MICDSCGYKNDDHAKSCIVCGNVLKPQLSDEELSDMLNRMSDRSDPLTASRLDKTIGLVFFAFALINLLLSIIFSAQPFVSAVATILAVVGGIVARYPQMIWKINMFRISVYANADDITPNDFWSLSRKVTYWILFVITIALTIGSLLIDRKIQYNIWPL